jgi:hypothetical protein
MSGNMAYVQFLRTGTWWCVIIIEQSRCYVWRIKCWEILWN